MSKFLVLLLTFLVLGAQAALPPTRSGEASGSLSTQFNWIYQDNHLTSLGGISKMVESDSLRLLNNQSFESPTAGEGWTYVPSGADVLTADLTDKIDGARSLEITPAAESFTLTQTAAIDQLAGSIIGFKVWVKADVPVQACFMRDATQSGCESYSGGGQWQEIFLYGNVVSGEAAGVQIGSVGSVTGTVNVDALRTIANPLAPTEIYASSEWEESGPINIRATSTAPTKGTIVVDSLKWRRVGDSMEVMMTYEQSSTGTAGSGNYIFDIPSGYNIDLNKIGQASTASDTRGSVLGVGKVSNQLIINTTTQQDITVVASDTRGVRFLLEQTNFNSLGYHESGFFNFAQPIIQFTAKFTVPIQGWSNTAQGVAVKTRTDNAAYENVFSARISSAAAVLSENIDWIDGDCTIQSTGDYVCDFVSGLFSETPSCVATNGDGNSRVVIERSITTSQIFLGVRTTTTAGGANSEVNLVCQRQGTDYIQEVDRINVVPVTELAGNSVRAQNNAGTALTSGVTDIDFTELVDTANAWSGTAYTVQQNNSKVSISLMVNTTSLQNYGLYLYVNGVQYRALDLTNDSTNVHARGYVSSRGEFNQGDVLTFRITASLTLSQNDTFHYLNINEEYEPSGLLVSADVTNVTEQVSRAGDLTVFYNEEMNTITTGEVVTGAGTFPSGGTFVGTVAKETVNPLAGTESFRFQQLAGSANSFIAFPAVPIELKNRGNLVAASVFTSFTGIDNSVDFIVYDDTNGAELGRVMIKSSTVGKEHRLVFNIPSNTTSLTYGFQVENVDDGSILLIDDVSMIVNPLESTDIKSKVSYFISQAGNQMPSQTGEFRYNLATADIEDFSRGNITAFDDTANSRTTFIFNQEGDAVINQSVYTAGVQSPVINYYDSSGVLIKSYTGTGGGSATQNSLVVTIPNVKVGEFVTQSSTSGGVRNTPERATVNIDLLTSSQGVVVKNRTDSASVENVFSAKIASDGTVTSENLDWIDGNCTKGSTGLYNCTFVSGLFSVAPSIVVSSGEDFRNASISSNPTTTDFSVQVRIPSTSTEAAIPIFVTAVRQGTDYIKETDKVYTVPIGFKESEYFSTGPGLQDPFWDGTGGQALWDASLLDLSTSKYLEVVDNFNVGVTTATIIRAKENLDISVTANGDVNSGSQVTVFKNSQPNLFSFENYQGTQTRSFASVSLTTNLKKGEYVWFYSGNQINRVGGINVWAKPSKEEGLWLGTFGQPTCIIQNRATAVAASPAASVTTLDLTDIQGNCSFVSLSSNEFTLEKGTYEIYARSMNYNNNSNQMYITDTSNNIQEGCVSDNGDAVAGTGDTGNMSLDCFLSLSSSATFRQRQFSQTASTEGLCRATHNETGNPATYTVCNRVKITKVR